MKEVFKLGLQARSTKLVPNLNKKFNIVDVIYGIEEYPKGTTRSKRLDSDLSKVFLVVRVINSKIHSQAIKDCMTLPIGKHDTQSISDQD